MSKRGQGEGSIYKRKDGRWVGSINLGWQDGKRQRRVIYGKTMVEVRTKLKAIQRTLDAGLPMVDERRTTGAYLNWWADTVLPGSVSEGSEDTYRRLLRLYVHPALDRVPLAKLTPGHVTEMMRGMEARGLSPATQNAARKVLGRALRRAMQEELIHRNVVSIVDGPRMSRKEGRSLTAAQAQTLLVAFQSDRLGAAYTLALALGLRRGEVLGACWEDFDLGTEPSVMTVRQQLQRRAGRGLVLVSLKTSKSRRTLTLPPQLVDVLRAHKASQAAERLAVGSLWAEGPGLAFTTPVGTPVDPDNFRHRLGKLTEAAGLGTWTTHELRHSAGSLLFAMGVPMKVISETLGHSSERVTSEVYVHLQAQHRAEAASAIGRALWGA